MAVAPVPTRYRLTPRPTSATRPAVSCPSTTESSTWKAVVAAQDASVGAADRVRPDLDEHLARPG
jgi:hypothetical protein